MEYTRCLCCGREFTKSSTQTERKNGWHKTCVSKFFNVIKLPKLDLTDELLQELAMQSTQSGYTVPGVQKKISLHLESDVEGKNARLTLVNYPTGYILKPISKEYELLPELEYIVMKMAQAVRIKTVPFSLIALQDGTLAYITKRIDRGISIDGNVMKLAMEDFCQLDGRVTEDKYKGSYERCVKIITRHSKYKQADVLELFYRLVFSFIIGNSDMHLKNFSLIETSYMSNQYVLAPAYDMLAVNLVLPTDEEETALTLVGKKKNLHRSQFLKFAKSIEIQEKVANDMIDELVSYESILKKIVVESNLISEEVKIKFLNLISSRIAKLSKVK